MSKVYPVEGFFISGIPHVEHDCDHEPPCVDTGAFTDKPPPRKAAAKQTEDPTEQVGSSDSED